MSGSTIGFEDFLDAITAKLVARLNELLGLGSNHNPLKIHKET